MLFLRSDSFLMLVEQISNIYDQEIIEFMHEIERLFQANDPNQAAVIRKAVSLVRMDAVTSCRFSENEQAVMANITGTESEVSRLSFTMQEAYCTCTSTRWCSHRIALIFYLYSNTHSLSDWLHDWRLEVRSEPQTLRLQQRTPEHWWDVLTEATASFQKLTIKDGANNFLHHYDFIEKRIKPLEPFEWEWKPLFRLYYKVRLLSASWPFLTSTLQDSTAAFSYGKWHIRSWLSEQIHQLQDALDGIQTRQALFEQEPFFTFLKSILRQFAVYSTGLFEQRFLIYRAFWESLFVVPKFRVEELQLLQQERTGESTIFIGYLTLLLNDEQPLIELVQHNNDVQLEQWIVLAKFAATEKKYELLTIIIRKVLPHIAHYYREELPAYSQNAFASSMDELLALAQIEDEVREQLFFSYGESAVFSYANFLVDRERFVDWAALLHRFQVPFDRIESEVLKNALAKDPLATFPLLHFYALTFIEEKNRHSYRKAVQIFKRMRTAAKRIGENDFWNRYIQQVRATNRRLRALSEEMDRGSLEL